SGGGQWYGRVAPFTTIAPDGGGLYYHRITVEGWLEIGRPQGTICLIRPAGRTGFQDSALIGCGNGAPHRLMVNDDLVHGVITATMDDVVETFRYDPDTGELLSP
ncbi:hypothetical protein ACTGWE_11765, partial [Streptococcus suis]